MATPIRDRAAEYAKLPGMTPRRIRARLRKEFPTAEKYELDTAVGFGATGQFPLWAYHNPLRPVTYRASRRRGR